MSERQSDLAPWRLTRHLPYAIAVVGIGAATAALVPLRSSVNPTTDALALLLVVLFVAARYGMGPAVVASAVGMLCFNFFFLPRTTR